MKFNICAWGSLFFVTFFAFSTSNAQVFGVEDDATVLVGEDVSSEEQYETFSPWYPEESYELMLRSSRKSPPLVTAIDYHTRNLYLINYKTDQIITVNPLVIKGWPDDVPLQHTIVSASGDRIIVTSDSTETHPAMAIELKVELLSWYQGQVSLHVKNIYELTEPDAAPLLPAVKPVNKIQNVPNWTLPDVRQIHGPTLLPRSNLVYLTDWTSAQIRILDVGAGSMASFDPLVYKGFSEQTHGVVFNKAGTIGLGTGYFYDNSYVDLYAVVKSGAVKPVKRIKLGSDKSYAAMTHYAAWLDNRFAYTATMQLDRTSLTPGDVEEIIGPSLWIIDSWTGKSKQVLGSTQDSYGNGVYRSASDMAIAGGKLFIAEEDSLDYDFGDDGYVAIYSLKNPLNPKLIKRLRPGKELPKGFSVAHTLSATPDDRHVYMASWASGFVVKINVATNNVEKVYGPDDGMVMPHGIFVSGQIR